MRFFIALPLNLLRRCCLPKPPAPAGTQRRWLPTHFHTAFSKRVLSTSQLLRNEAIQNGDPATMKLDLDVWKSVMRSPGAQKEEAEEAEPGAERSPLEATRELVEMWRQAGKLVPEEMSDQELQTLQELSTKSSKKKYLKYLAIKEGHKKSRKQKKEKKRSEKSTTKVEEDIISRSAEGEGMEEEEGSRHLRNTFLLQFWERSMDTLYNWRAAQAMLFGQPLVFDMSYEQHMSRRELENTVSQLLECEGWNRRSADPFHLHFCGLQPDGGYHRELSKRYGATVWDRLLITATSQRQVDLFPQERLVYLTADSPNVLRAFDHSKVYIVGAMVDKSIQSGLSLANAKRFRLATARLPLDEFLHWDTGAKNLTLDQMIRILLRLKDSGKWEEALKFVPKRKHDGFYQPSQSRTHAHSGKGRISVGNKAAPTTSGKAETLFNKGPAPTTGNKARTFIGRKGDGHNTTVEKNQFALPRVGMVLKSSRLEENDAKLKRRKNWWEEE